MLDVSMVGNGEVYKIDTIQWSEKDNVTLLSFQTGEPGTWVAGVSTAPNDIEMDAEAFNTYLEHEGILDMIQWRKDNNAEGLSAIEKYSKHVKTFFQVEELRTNDWQRPLGYPIEFIPLSNPYEVSIGEQLSVQLLYDGKPLANQLVYADVRASASGHHHDDHHGHNHEHDSDEEPHTHTSGQQLRTNADGIVTADLTKDGIWYFQTIYLVNTNEEGYTHESNWSTMTFEVAHVHGSHTHSHFSIKDIPTYIFGIGGLLIGVLLLFFLKRGKS